MIHETIAALVFVSLLWINSLMFYTKEPTNLNGWLMSWNAGMVAFVVYQLLIRISL